MGYKISVMLGFGGLCGLSDGRFCYDISMMAGFVQLRDLNESIDVGFAWL